MLNAVDGINTYVCFDKVNIAMTEKDSNLLTNEIVRDAPTKKKSYTIRDGRGLFVLVHQNGSRYFQLRATVSGKRKLMQIGVYPTISIEEARVLAAQRLQEEVAGVGVSKDEFNFTENPPENRPAEFAEIENISPLITDEVLSNHLAEGFVRVMDTTHLAEFAEETFSKPTPEVNLAYSDLVYVTKNPAKTFGQKLSERLQLEARLNAANRTLARMLISTRAWTFTNLIRMALKLRDLKARFSRMKFAQINLKDSIGRIHLWQVFSGLREQIHQLTKSFIHHVGCLINVLGCRGRAFAISLKGMWQKAFDHIQAIRGSSWVNEVNEVKSKSNKEGVRIYTINPNALLKKIKFSDFLVSILYRENLSARQDRAHVFGLFAESKGNYLIYTIKIIVSALLAKKG